MLNFRYTICAVMALLMLSTTATFAAPINTSLTDTQKIELITRLQTLLLQLQKQLAQLKEQKIITTESNAAAVKSETPKAGAGFVHVKNIDTKKVSTDGTLRATSGDRIEFTWRTEGMKECNFTTSDFTNNALVKTAGYKVITAPEKKGSYEYSVGCTDTKGEYYYTKISLDVTAESSTAPKMTLEVQNRSVGSSYSTNDITVNPSDELVVRWDASDYDECELTHTSYGDVISHTTTGHISNIVAGRPGRTVMIKLECEKDMDTGPDITGYKMINVTTTDPDGRSSELG